MSAEKMTKSKIISQIAAETQLAKRDVEAVFGSLYGVMEEQLGKKGPGEFTIPGIVKLRVVQKKATPAREGRNPSTGETITIPAKPAHKVVKATVLKATKDLV